MFLCPSCSRWTHNCPHRTAVKIHFLGMKSRENKRSPSKPSSAYCSHIHTKDQNTQMGIEHFACVGELVNNTKMANVTLRNLFSSSLLSYGCFVGHLRNSAQCHQGLQHFVVKNGPRATWGENRLEEVQCYFMVLLWTGEKESEKK